MLQVMCKGGGGYFDKHIYCQLIVKQIYFDLMNVAILKREKLFVTEKYYGKLVSDVLRFMK